MSMRAAWVGVICSAILACGGSDAPPVSSGGGPSAHTLAVTVTGSGVVKSAPGGIDCGTACAATFPQGSTVTLTAAPAAGSVFSGWGGACSGSATCAVAIAADTAVTARFEAAPPPPPPPPPPPGTHALTVAVQGQGTVTSSPAGIDCGATCTANFSEGTAVQLTATPAPGWSLTAFSGACSGGACTVTLSSDQSVSATFTQAPPPPVDECAGLTPASLPAPVVATLPQNSCLDGTSDDGTGNYLLGFTAGPGPVFPEYLFFTIQDGKAVRIGDTVMGGDESGTYVYSQPAGFSVFSVSGNSGGSVLATYDHQGNQVRSERVLAGSFEDFPSSAVGIDPAGGVAVARHSKGASGWVTTYQRHDKTGASESEETTIDSGGGSADGAVLAAGVALSHDALIIKRGAGGAWRARWLSVNGRAITDWFDIPSPSADSRTKWAVARFLMDGSVVVGFRPGAQGASYQGVDWRYRIEDGKNTTSDLPSWIAERPSHVWYVIRNGAGYAAFGASSGFCKADSVEVLATSGKSCGCLQVPQISGRSSVGRDGSLIVPRQAVNFGTCQYDLHPQLLK